jgi:hypothetical protein
VTVSPAQAPYLTLYVTDTIGAFTISDVCIGQELLFTKAGHVDEISEVTTVGSLMQIKLAEIGEREVIVHFMHRYLIIAYSRFVAILKKNNVSPEAQHH